MQLYLTVYIVYLTFSYRILKTKPIGTYILFPKTSLNPSLKQAHEKGDLKALHHMKSEVNSATNF